MPDDPIRPGELPSDEDFEERFRKVRQQFEAVEDEDEPPSHDLLSRSFHERAQHVLHDVVNPQFELTDDQLKQRAAQLDEEIRKASKGHDPEIPEIESRMESVSKRARDARDLHINTARSIERGRELDAQAVRGAGVGLRIAYAFLGTPLMFALIGFLIERVIHGNGLIIAFSTLVGFAIGMVAAISMMYRDQPKG